ncbi:hypothetical protein HYH02_010849 [Chlamydomonas schloesseri]|uniref:tRNA-uridine aminocarboxypropyltransferase n=1 Tax=Chlamydomonas schloesseri TaxID=2026947 RepID=A0A835TDK6_9CHLO|nr:hypothetical protein HYH02_010849 [Chlamydomonas schloesseri]|eukprot:KAG2438394.1 hypothetical protein HYH02_010849 [Chlamydomonas schloesseri]
MASAAEPLPRADSEPSPVPFTSQGGPTPAQQQPQPQPQPQQAGGAVHLKGHRKGPGGSGQATRAKHQQQHGPQGAAPGGGGGGKGKGVPRLAKMQDGGGLEALLGGEGAGEGEEGVFANEEELVAKLMTQLQGLSHKQQKMYGIWDEAAGADAGRVAFVEQWRKRHAERRAMVAALSDPSRDPRERMSLRTDYILKWRKVLFSCPTCWLLPGLCVCGRMQRFAPKKTRVVVHAHHGEWGSASNSGSILPLSLEGSEMLLYGHPDHDERLRAMLADTSRTVALLWPGADSLLPEQLQAVAEERSGGQVTVVALDATWGNARRMQGWFPKGTLTVKLPPESTLKENKLSLLRPVRKYRGDLESGRVSTVEAVASLLFELEGDEPMYRGLLENLKIKVDACRLQKNRTLVYDTQQPHHPASRPRMRGKKKQEEGGGDGDDGDGASASDEEGGGEEVGSGQPATAGSAQVAA